MYCFSAFINLKKGAFTFKIYQQLLVMKYDEAEKYLIEKILYLFISIKQFYENKTTFICLSSYCDFPGNLLPALCSSPE